MFLEANGTSRLKSYSILVMTGGGYGVLFSETTNSLFCAHQNQRDIYAKSSLWLKYFGW